MTTRSQKPSKFYAIAKGKQTGIYDNWAICQPLVDRVKSNRYKGFNNYAAAEKFLQDSGVPVTDRRTKNKSECTDNGDMNSSCCSLSGSSSSEEEEEEGDEPAESNIECDCKQQVEHLLVLVHQLQTRVDQLETEVSSKSTTESYVQVLKTPSKRPTPQSTQQSPGSPQRQRQTPAPNPGPQVKFLPERNLVISKLEGWPGTTKISEMSLRATIAKLNISPKPVVTNVHFYNPHEPCVMITFLSNEMVDAVLASWIDDSTPFGELQLRRPRERTKKPIGMLRGVPLELDDTAVQELLDDNYNDTTTTRLTSSRGPLQTVKVVFKTDSDLEDAMTKGLVVEDLCLKIRVEAAIDRPPRVTQCYKCYKLGHIARDCSAAENKCGNCGGEQHIAQDCANPPRCVNCAGPHRSSDRTCPIYTRKLHQLINRRSNN